MRCSICATPNCTSTCGGCELRVYCGDACADADWASHYLGTHCPQGDHVADLVLTRRKISEGDIYVGGIESLSDETLMHDIGAVVSCLVADATEEALMERKLAGRPHFEVPVWDNPDAPIEKYWPDAARFIDEHVRMGHSVLVHCHAGRSRSVSTVIYYMMRYRGYASADIALKYIQRARPMAGPNEGFMSKLIL